MLLVTICMVERGAEVTLKVFNMGAASLVALHTWPHMHQPFRAGERWEQSAPFHPTCMCPLLHGCGTSPLSD